ncbi:hypothetical protein [Porphyromonas gingivalis]
MKIFSDHVFQNRNTRQAIFLRSDTTLSLLI